VLKSIDVYAKKTRTIEDDPFQSCVSTFFVAAKGFSRFFLAPFPHHFGIEIWFFTLTYILLKNAESLKLQRFVEIYGNT